MKRFILVLAFSTLLVASIHGGPLSAAGSVTEADRALMRLVRILPLSPLFAALDGEKILFSIEDPTPGADPRSPIRSFKIRIAAALALARPMVSFIEGGSGQLTRQATRNAYAVPVGEQIVVETNIVRSANGLLFTNLVFRTNQIIAPLGSIPLPFVPHYAIDVNPLNIDFEPIRSGGWSAFLTGILGPITEGVTGDVTYRSRKSEFTATIVASAAAFQSQIAAATAKTDIFLRKLDRSFGASARWSSRLAGSLDADLTVQDTLEKNLSDACVIATRRCLSLLAGLPAGRISTTERIDDPLSRQAVEEVWRTAPVEARRAAVRRAVALAASAGWSPPEGFPDPTSALAAGKWRRLLETMPLPSDGFAPAPSQKPPRGWRRLCFEHFPRNRWTANRPWIVSEVLKKAPGIRHIKEDPSSDIVFVVKPDGPFELVISQVAAGYRSLTSAEIDVLISTDGVAFFQYRGSLPANLH